MSEQGGKKIPVIKVIKKEDPDNTLQIPEEDLMEINGSWLGQGCAIDVRHGGPLKGRAFILDSHVRWVHGMDQLGLEVLIPLPKE